MGLSGLNSIISRGRSVLGLKGILFYIFPIPMYPIINPVKILPGISRYHPTLSAPLLLPQSEYYLLSLPQSSDSLPPNLLDSFLNSQPFLLRTTSTVIFLKFKSVLFKCYHVFLTLTRLSLNFPQQEKAFQDAAPAYLPSLISYHLSLLSLNSNRVKLTLDSWVISVLSYLLIFADGNALIFPLPT